MVNGQTNENTRDQKVLSISAAYMVSFMGILSCVNQLGNLIGIHTTIDTFICYTALVVLTIYGTYTSFKIGVRADVFLIFSFIALCWLFSYLVFSQNRTYMLTSFSDYAGNPFYVLFLYSLPCMFIVRAINDYSIFDYYMIKFSYIVVTLSVLVYIFARNTTSGQYMTLSYNMLVHVLYLVFSKPKRHRIIHWIIVVLGSFVVVFGGARGALLGFVIPVLLFGLIKDRPSLSKIVLIITLFSLAIIIFLYYQPIMLSLDGFLESFGIKSTTINKLLYYGDDFSSGRTTFYDYLWNRKNLIGFGLYGDRVLLRQLGRTNSYAHNMFIEWIIDYGLIFGSVICLTFIGLLVNALRKRHNQEWKHIILFLSLGLVAPMLSGSYLSQEPCIFVLIALCLNATSERKAVVVLGKNI